MKLLCLVLKNYQDIELITYVSIIKRSSIFDQISFYNPSNESDIFGVNKIASIKCKNQINIDEYDALYIAGGPAAKELCINKNALSVVKNFVDKDKWIIAHCDSPNALFQAGLLQDKTFISYPPNGRWEKISSKRINNQNTLVHVDKKYISGRSPLATFALALKTIEILASAKEAKEIEDGLLGIE